VLQNPAKFGAVCRQNQLVYSVLFPSDHICSQDEISKFLLLQIVPDKVEQHLGSGVNQSCSTVGKEVLINAAPICNNLTLLQRIQNFILEYRTIVAKPKIKTV
jgi:hypothetical protein